MKKMILVGLLLSTIFMVGCNVIEIHRYDNIDLNQYKNIRWTDKEEHEGYTVKCDNNKCCRKIHLGNDEYDGWCYTLNNCAINHIHNHN